MFGAVVVGSVGAMPAAYAEAEPEPVSVQLRDDCTFTVYPPYAKDPTGNPTISGGRITLPEDMAACGERP